MIHPDAPAAPAPSLPDLLDAHCLAAARCEQLAARRAKLLGRIEDLRERLAEVEDELDGARREAVRAHAAWAEAMARGRRADADEDRPLFVREVT